MDYKELVKALRCDGNNIGQDSGGCTNKKCRYRDPDSACNIVSICEDAAAAITDLLVENQSLRNAANGFKARVKAAEARCKTLEKMVREYQDEIVPGYRERAEKAEKIASDLCDDFTDFVTTGIHNAAPYCANRRPECVDGRGWCKEDLEYCRGFSPKAEAEERGV